MDNYATHKTPKIKAWLARRPHWHVHFTPTSASWINQVERWFAELTRKQLQRGVHRSTAELEADIAPFEGLLLGIFFTAIGMSLNLKLLVSEPVLIALLTMFVLPLTALAGLNNRTDRKSMEQQHIG